MIPRQLHGFVTTATTNTLIRSTTRSINPLSRLSCTFVLPSFSLYVHFSFLDLTFSEQPFQSYLVGLWFSLRTHASQIWQNPRQLLHPSELPTHQRLSLYNRGPNTGQFHSALSRKPSAGFTLSTTANSPRAETPGAREASTGSVSTAGPAQPQPQAQQQQPIQFAAQQGQHRLNPPSPTFPKRVSYATAAQQPSYGPVLESVDHAVKTTDLGDVHLPSAMTTDDFTRAVAVATVSALRHQQQTASHSPARTLRHSGLESEAGTVGTHGGAQGGGDGGHDAPSWSRTTSASVLLGCTALYAVIAGEYRRFWFRRVFCHWDGALT